MISPPGSMRTRTLRVRGHVEQRPRSIPLGEEHGLRRLVAAARGHTHAPNRREVYTWRSGVQGKGRLEYVLELLLGTPDVVGPDPAQQEQVTVGPQQQIRAVQRGF